MVLKEWYFYAARHRVQLDPFWTSLTAHQGRIMTVAEDMGGPFVAAIYENVEAPTDPEPITHDTQGSGNPL